MKENNENNLEQIIEENKYSHSLLRRWAVDTSLAHIVYTPIYAVAEHLYVGMNNEDLTKSRGLGLIVGSGTTLAYTLFADWLIKKCNVNKESSKLKRYSVETLGGLAGFALGVGGYYALLKIINIPQEQNEKAIIAAVSITLTTTYHFRIYMNKWRKYWNVKPALDE